MFDDAQIGQRIQVRSADFTAGADFPGAHIAPEGGDGYFEVVRRFAGGKLRIM